MRSENSCQSQKENRSLIEACSDGDARTVQRLLTEGQSVHETTAEGKSLLSLASSAGYSDLAQVLLAMNANVEDRGIKGDCTPLMEAASAGHVDIVSLLIAHGADVNAQSTSGNTPLMYGCAGGHEEVVKVLLEAGANVEDHNENGHTPLMEAASAGHVSVAKILLEHGAGINTHSNEFKESALTLACYKGHLDMVRFLLEAGADQEHKTDEMHTALMEASMDGHVEVARLLLDSGAQVNMPTDSFESPLTLAACGGHVDLAMLLIERGANIEEVNDEGYTPLMEAAREGHEEMVALLLSQGANINAQTEETQETALTLACCGGFLEVADFLIKAGADIELGASTPLMEAAQEGHLDLVRYLLETNANVHAQTQTGDTALTYACENGHTDVADLLLQFGADLEHESEGGRTPLMKACRAGHLCTVQFLISKRADVNRQTTNNDHTPLSLACAGGHLAVVELLLSQSADPFHKLKDNSTMLIEAAKGGHTSVVQLLLDYPHSIMMNSTQNTSTSMLLSNSQTTQVLSQQPQQQMQNQQNVESNQTQTILPKHNSQKSLLRKNRSVSNVIDVTLTSAEAQQVRSQPSRTPTGILNEETNILDQSHANYSGISEPNMSFISPVSNPAVSNECRKNSRHEQILHKQQILEELQHTSHPGIDQVDSDVSKFHRDSACPFFSATQRNKIISNDDEILKLEDGTQIPIDEAVNIFESISFDDINNDDSDKLESKKLEVFGNKELSSQQIEQAMPANSRSQAVRDIFAIPVSTTSSSSSVTQLQLENTSSQNQTGIPIALQSPISQPLPKQMLSAFEAGLSIGIQRRISDENFQTQLLLQSNQLGFTAQGGSATCSSDAIEMSENPENVFTQSLVSNTNQVQVATQTQSPLTVSAAVTPSEKKSICSLSTNNVKGKKTRYLFTQQQTNLSSTPSTQQLATNLASQNFQMDPTTISNQYTTGNSTGSFSSNQIPPAPFSCMDVDSETDSNHDTALTLACAGGHEELVELLLSRGADIEHRDKKGFTPLILAATAGHQKVVEILFNHGADIEAQSERTKDTPLSLACSGGRYEVVELLLNRGANKEHRNVSDYTPLSLAASGGYVNIIKLLLSHGAEINSRTGSKLGISPLMLAAMNGHTAAVKLLLDMGSDINAQIETNRNTALTLACFQGRHEVVSLLLDRKANVEHRAKTGLTPLMEAASGGYVEVGRVLLNKGADVNATPVPSSRDTALTIAADKGHCRFVELLLSKGTQVEVKNKKGNSPLWLAANGGHLNVVDLLYHAGADIDSQDNRKVSCLMAAFRKGHIKVVKWMVNHVTQFPSDQEMTRYIATVSDKELLERCHECVKIIRAAKETQAAKANKNATILLEELDMEKNREESKKAAAARRRERKKKKKLEKKEEKRKLQEENKKNEAIYEDKDIIETKVGDEGSYKEEDSDHDDNFGELLSSQPLRINRNVEDSDKEEGDSGIDANSQGSCTGSHNLKAREKKKDKKKKKIICCSLNASLVKESSVNLITKNADLNTDTPERCLIAKSLDEEKHPADREDFEATGNETYISKGKKNCSNLLELDASNSNAFKISSHTSPKQSGKREEGWKEVVRKGQTDDSGKFMNSPFRSKKVAVPPNAISRVIGRGGSNINTIRAATGAHIEVEKQSKSQGERIITIKGSLEATKQAHILIIALIKDPDVDILQMLPKSKPASASMTSWDKSISSTIACKLRVVPSKLPLGLITTAPSSQISKPTNVSSISTMSQILPVRSNSSIKPLGTPVPRVGSSRLNSNTEKKTASHVTLPSNTKTTMSYTSAIMTAGRTSKIVTTNTSQTFAAKLTEIYTPPQSCNTSQSVNQCNQNSSNVINIVKQTITPNTSVALASTSSVNQVSHQQLITQSLTNPGPSVLVVSPSTAPSQCSGKLKFSSNSVSLSPINSNPTNNQPCLVMTSSSSISSANSLPTVSQAVTLQQFRSSTPIVGVRSEKCHTLSSNVPLEYSLFNDTFSKVTQQSMWGSKEIETQKSINFATIAGTGISVSSSTAPSNTFIDTSSMEVDASKAPGYRGTSMCSPTSNKSSANNAGNSTVTTSSLNSTASSPVQQVNIQSSVNYTGTHTSIKSPVNLSSTKPHVTPKSMEMDVASIPPFIRPVFHGNIDTSQGITGGLKTCTISAISHNNLEANIYNESNIGYENQNLNSNLLNIIPNENQTNNQSILPIHQHIQSYPQTVAPSSVVTTTISISRLNPRAPDFSSSMHLNSKPQATMFSPVTPMHPNIFSTTPAQPSTTVIQSNNLAILGNFNFNKYQSSAQRQSNVNIPTCIQNRWPFVPPINYSTHQDSLANFPDHIANLSVQSGNLELINLENGSISPAISPSSTGQVLSQDVSQMQIEDRKIPRPIGTERTWKNYSTGNGPAGDSDNITWVTNNEKHINSWSGMSSNTDRNQLYCSNTTFNRISASDTELHQIMETSYQGSRFGS
ncbi:ankyrin repeat and KH domain-containing protein mask isoform X6 [Nasonia vitripennis]|uniref:K Homology domain-containing protein n=1 Tax=Nasonia vitripennis TaxID=7425 RepID=A0A7M7TA20_NASVI|nr:ankyrin repeat and KH domain-containing protein mask isoform X6 [Nasonia vitripennis]